MPSRRRAGVRHAMAGEQPGDATLELDVVQQVLQAGRPPGQGLAAIVMIDIDDVIDDRDLARSTIASAWNNWSSP